MSWRETVSCPSCGTDVSTIPVQREWHRCEVFERACPTCLTRFTLDGVTWSWTAALPAPVPLGTGGTSAAEQDVRRAA